MTRPEQARDPRRLIALTPQDIARINPNTRTLPIFRTPQDAALTRAIYRRVPVLVNERTGENPWRVSFKQGLFNMSSDSGLFRTQDALEREGFTLQGNRFVKGEACYLPLYEAKMIWHYDHRYGTYAGAAGRGSTQLPTPDDAAHADPGFVVQPWYWVRVEEVEARLGNWKRKWLIGFRNVTNATNERTAIFSLLPLAGVGNSLPILLLDTKRTSVVACIVGNLSAILFDWIARQKLAGVNMNFFYVEQFPVLPPHAYGAADLRYLVPRVLELTYTAWDMAPFAADVWSEADDDLRAAIRAQRGVPSPLAPPPEGEGSNPPSPLGRGGQGGEGIPLPPFKW
ncbi:MAG: hypothetical protein NZ693_02555, partial [Thermoflexales bacterium]|nr:hypothetical protein [Thermoflexales bacterium]